MWDRDEYLVDSDSFEEALDRIKKHFNDEDFDDPLIPDSTDSLDTIEELTPQENDNCATRELIYVNEEGMDKPIMDNSIPAQQNPHL
jgi:hypothetical protein